MVEHDVGSDEVGRHVGEHPGRDLPEQLVSLVRSPQAADARCVGRMAGREVEDIAGTALAATALDELVDDGPNARDLAGVEQRLDPEVPVRKVILALLLAEDPRGVGQHVFRRHRIHLPGERSLADTSVVYQPRPGALFMRDAPHYR